MLEIEREHILRGNKSDEMLFTVTKRESRWSTCGILGIPLHWDHGEGYDFWDSPVAASVS
jgi:hypothetical protein